MNASDETKRLIELARCGDAGAREQLLALHRDRLARMVAMRMDPRARARFDPSDVVQEALLTASGRLSDYIREQPIPFYPWLRKIAWEHLVKFHERHVSAKKRSIQREEAARPPLTDASVGELLDRFVASHTGPSERAIRNEMRSRANEALARLKPHDREIIELRYLEQLEYDEIAAILEISLPAVRTRHFRAIQKLNRVLRAEDT